MSSTADIAVTLIIWRRAGASSGWSAAMRALNGDGVMSVVRPSGVRAQALGARVLKRGANWIETKPSGSPHDLALALGALDDVYLIEGARPPYKLHNEQAEANCNAFV